MTRTGVRALIIGGLSLALFAVHVVAQQRLGEPTAPPTGATGSESQPMFAPPPPQTRLEGLAAQEGVLIVKGYSDIGEVQSDDGSRLRVTAVTFTDAKQNREQGLVITIEQRDQTPAIAYVDADEMDGLAEALDQLAKLENGASSMNNVEGAYRTRGDLEITNDASNGGGRVATVRATQILVPSGQVLQAQASLRPARLGEIRQQIAQAKDSLDHARTQPAAGK